MNDRPTSGQSPFRLNLEQQKIRAKELQRAVRAGDGAAQARLRARHPHADDVLAQPKLADAQLVIARELGLASWPKLKAHVAQLDLARDAITRAGEAPDTDMPTLHVRCGSDIGGTLKEAGFAGAFLEWSDPLGQGPVIDGPDWVDRRARFLTDSYGAEGGYTFEGNLRTLQGAERRLGDAARDYPRVVLWTEHDSYDQLALTRWLAQFAETGAPAVLELVSVDHFPGGVRFIGIGQLPPEAIRMLWSTRRPVTPAQLTLGRNAFAALRQGDPSALAAIMRSGTPALPQLAPALHRHLQELPSVRTGLSLTEQLALQIVSEESRTVGRVFHALMTEREPLPWLGDLMFWHIVESMGRAREPALSFAAETVSDPWPRRCVTITETGRQVLQGRRDALSLSPPVRFVGGVEVRPGASTWRWDEDRRQVVRA